MGHFDKTPPPQVDDLAKKVTEQVSNGHLDGAYAMLKKELQTEFSTMPLEEKRETWNALSKKLEENGTLPKLSAAWLSDWSTNMVTPAGSSFAKGTFEKVANVLDPMTAGFAGEISKQFDVASRLGTDDGKIDPSEIAAFKARQTQLAPDKFADEIARKTAEKYTTASPADAYKYLSAELYRRTKQETPEEEAATWKLVDAKLHEKGLIPKLSMGFLETSWSDKPATLRQMEGISKQESINPLTREVAGYIAEAFPKIGTVDYRLDEISVAERKLYTDKLNQK